MSNEATRIYSTCFSMASGGYCERRRVVVLEGMVRTDWCSDPCDECTESTSSGSRASRSMGGCGERAFRSLRMEIDEGERDEGKDEKEGWRWSEVPSCWACAGGSEGELVPLPDEGGCGRCAATCIAAKAMVSIFTARLASLAYCAICARGPHQGCADAYALEWMRCLSAVVRQYVALSASGIAIADRGGLCSQKGFGDRAGTCA